MSHSKAVHWGCGGARFRTWSPFLGSCALAASLDTGKGVPGYIKGNASLAVLVSLKVSEQEAVGLWELWRMQELE